MSFPILPKISQPVSGKFFEHERDLAGPGVYLPAIELWSKPMTIYSLTSKQTLGPRQVHFMFCIKVKFWWNFGTKVGYQGKSGPVIAKFCSPRSVLVKKVFIVITLKPYSSYHSWASRSLCFSEERKTKTMSNAVKINDIHLGRVVNFLLSSRKK